MTETIIDTIFFKRNAKSFTVYYRKNIKDLITLATVFEDGRFRYYEMARKKGVKRLFRGLLLNVTMNNKALVNDILARSEGAFFKVSIPRSLVNAAFVLDAPDCTIPKKCCNVTLERCDGMAIRRRKKHL